MARASVDGGQLARIRRSVEDAAARAASPEVRGALLDLRGRLERAHADVESVREARWADYAAALDRGLAELDVEVRRAADGPVAEASLDDVLFGRIARFELDGWALRLAALQDRGEAPAAADAAVAGCAGELAAYGAACRTDPAPPRDRVAGSLDAVRAAVEGT